MATDTDKLTLFDCRCQGLEVIGHCEACRCLVPWRPPSVPRGPEDEPIRDLLLGARLPHRKCGRPLSRIEVRRPGNMMGGHPLVAAYSIHDNVEGEFAVRVAAPSA